MCERCKTFHSLLKRGRYAEAHATFVALPHRVTPAGSVKLRLQGYQMEVRTSWWNLWSDELEGPWRLLQGERAVLYGFDDLFWGHALISPHYTPGDAEILQEFFGLEAELKLAADLRLRESGDSYREPG